MRSISFIAVLAATGFLFAGVGTASAAKTSCAVCHNAMTGSTTLASGEEIELGVDMNRFEASVHGFMGCTECHMKFDENPHTPPSAKVSETVQKIADSITPKAGVDPVAYGSCSQCHPDIYSQVLGSIHGQNVTEKGAADGALCLDCHGSPHYITSSKEPDSRIHRANVIETCGSCHGSEELQGKYGLEPHVMQGYMESFHGKKHHLGHTGAPTCVSCHGAHDIRTQTDPASPVFGTTSKMAMCGGCHTGANAKFVTSYTHKPPGPIPHYAEKGLIVLLISTIAFTIVHVILEAYADIRDTVFRKEGGKQHESAKECA